MNDQTRPKPSHTLTSTVNRLTGASNGSYGYIFLPNASVAETGRAWTNGQVTRQCTAAAHYARGRFSTLDVHGGAFWEAASIGALTADAPLTVIVRASNGGMAITVSDPTQLRPPPITVRVDLPNSGVLSSGASIQVPRSASSATLAFSPSGSKGRGARAVVSA